MKAKGINNPSEKMNKRLYTIKEAATYLGRPIWSIRELIWAGKIPFIQTGRIFYLDIYDIDKWIEQNKNRFAY